jgi:glutaredoxin
LSDFWPHGRVAEEYGVLRAEGYTERALFVIDKFGKVAYMDIHDIDHQPDNEVLREAIRRIDPEAAANEPRPEAPQPVALPHGGIVMYCTQWCPDCRRARLWLAERHLPYTEVDITTTPGAAEQVMKWANGFKTTPTFEIDGKIVVNFDERRLREILNIN